MHHVADRPDEEIRAIELYTLLGREGVQVRLNNISVKATSRWSRQYLCLLIIRVHPLIF